MEDEETGTHDPPTPSRTRDRHIRTEESDQESDPAEQGAKNPDGDWDDPNAPRRSER
jgi:hypothetical protein